MNRIHSDEFMAIDHDSGRDLLVLTWTDATERIGEDGFRSAMSLYAELAGTHRPRGLVVDVRSFGHTMSHDSESWRGVHITPRYRHAGVRRMAFVHNEGGSLPTASQGPYENRHFDDLAQAAGWASTGHAVHICVSYTVSSDDHIAVVKEAVGTFLSQVRAVPGIDYVSGQSLADPLAFNHVVRCVDGASLKDLQDRDFFAAFGPILRPLCAVGPSVTRYAVVAAAQP